MHSKHLSIIIAVSVIINLLLVWQVWAGSPDSPGAPTATSSYTLEDIFNRLNSGVMSAPSTFTEPTVAPGTATMHTLNEIMAKAPSLDNTHGATATHILSGQTAWGLTLGQWGVFTGTMPNNGAVVLVATTTDQAIGAGYHNGNGLVQGDADLSAANIKQGVNLFSVNGSLVGASGNATDTEVLNGVTYSNSSGPSTGTMQNNGAGSTIVPTTTNQIIAAGYWATASTIQGDTDLVAANIKQGVNLFGVDGMLSSTYDAGVPKTGQTTSYASGDDGVLQQGVAWPSPRFTDNGNGTVIDNLTGLIWLKSANCFGAKNWTTALNDANTLNDDECGLSDGSLEGDWRLPNAQELQSLIDYGRYSPALPSGHPFSGVLSSNYWSSSTYASITSNAWYVSTIVGAVAEANKTSNNFYVWPVRGGQ